jgi:hypothetical protein
MFLFNLRETEESYKEQDNRKLKNSGIEYATIGVITTSYIHKTAVLKL